MYICIYIYYTCMHIYIYIYIHVYIINRGGPDTDGSVDRVHTVCRNLGVPQHLLDMVKEEGKGDVENLIFILETLHGTSASTFFKMWATNPQLWVLTQPKRLVMVYSSGL